MDFGIDPGLVMFYFISFLFGIWPIALLTPITWKRNILESMSVIWGILAVFRLILLIPNEAEFTIINEPLNTFLFLLAGILLLVAWFAKRSLLPIFSIRKYSKIQDLETIQKLSPTDFEELVVALYASMGHSAKRVGGQGDHGIDIKIKARNGETWIAQCKRWKGSVGEPVIRDLYGTLQHEKADRAALITTGTYSNDARRWAKGKPIDLVNGTELIRLWNDSHSKKMT